MFSRVVWILVLLTVAVTPLVFSMEAKNVYRLPKALFFQAATLLLGAVVVAWDANRGELGKLAARHRLPLMLAAAAVLWTAVITMTAQNPTVAGLKPLAVFCYAAFFAVALLFARRTPGLALTALLTPAAINVFVMILQWREILTPHRVMHENRHTGLQGNPDPAGAYLIVPVIAAIAAIIAFRRWRLVLIPVLALLLGGVVLTGTITVFIALAAVFVAFIVVVPSRKTKMAMIAAIVAGAVVLGAYGPTRARLIGIARSAAAGNFQEVTSFRLPAWSVAWQMFLDHPLTGIGPGGYSAKYMSYKLAGDERHPQWMTLGNFNFAEAHNDYLQLLAEAGLPGLALFIVILGSVALLSLRSRGSGEEGAFVRLFALPAVVGFAVAAIAQFPLHLTATCAVAVFAAALCFAWSAGFEPAAPPASSRHDSSQEPAGKMPAERPAGSRRSVRVAVAAALCAVVALVIARTLVPRYHCSVEKKRIESWLETEEQQSFDRRLAVARTMVPRLQQCVEQDPSDFEAFFLLGAARRDSEQPEAALQAFAASLALNERPETYTSLALVELEMGKADEARRNLRQAVFFNLDMIDHVDDEMRNELEVAVAERQARLKGPPR